MKRILAWIIQRLSGMFDGAAARPAIWRHPESGTIGTIEATALQPDGMLVRINDHWFKANELVPADNPTLNQMGIMPGVL